jgi:TonB family protein
MSQSRYAGRARFGLLPEPESNPGSFLTSCILNIGLLALLLLAGSFAHKEIEQRKLESMDIVFPTTPPPEIKPKVKIIPPPKMPEPPKPAIVKLELPKINVPKPEPKPEIKPLPIVKEPVNLPKIAAKPQIVTLAPQPKAALVAAAAPALVPQQKVSTAPVHFGDLNGVKPNPNATAPATIAAIGNPYGGNTGPAEAPRGIVGSAGFGNGIKSGSSAGTVGKVASAGFPGSNGSAPTSTPGNGGKVAAAVIPAITAQANQPATVAKMEDTTTPPVVVSYAKAEYTSEALQLKIQGEVVLRVKVTTNGQAVVLGVLHGLGHGLDEAAVRSAPTYRFKPATRNGQPVEFTTNIIVKFQTA